MNKHCKSQYDELIDVRATRQAVIEELLYLGENISENQLYHYIKFTSSVIKVSKSFSNRSQDSIYLEAMEIKELKDVRINRIIAGVGRLENKEIANMILDKYVNHCTDEKLEQIYECTERSRRRLLYEAYLKIASYLDMEIRK